MDPFVWKLLVAWLVIFYALGWRELLGKYGLVHPDQSSFDPVRCAELHNLLLLKALNRTDMYVSLQTSSQEYQQ